MREKGTSQYPSIVDNLIFYQDPNIDKYPLLARYYQILKTNDFDAAHDYLQSVDLDYYGAWLLNKIEDRLITVERNIDDVLGEKPKLVIYDANEPEDSEFTDECFCWTGDLGIIITDRFWHNSFNSNPMHAVDGTVFYFKRGTPSDPFYQEGMYGLIPTTVKRTSESSRGTTNDPGISVFEVNSLRNQTFNIPLYNSDGSESDVFITLTFSADNPSSTANWITLEAILKENSMGTVFDIETSYNHFSTGNIPVSDNHYYLFAGVDTISGDEQGKTTISNVLYFGFIQNYIYSDKRYMDFGGVGIDLLNVEKDYHCTVNPNYIPPNPVV